MDKLPILYIFMAVFTDGQYSLCFLSGIRAASRSSPKSVYETINAGED
ncbi:hypothetical protein [Mucilaginibacter lappiensis]